MRTAIKFLGEDGEVAFLIAQEPVRQEVFALANDLRKLFLSGEDSCRKEAYALINNAYEDSVIEDYRDDVKYVGDHWETADKETVNTMAV